MEESGIIFCPLCNNLLQHELADYGKVDCQSCKSRVDISEIIKKIKPTVTTLDIKHSFQTNFIVEDEKTKSRAIVKEPCPKCGHEEARYYTLQLRSVDEGATVFYECDNSSCGQKWSVNN
eukprot:TRINITY_DN44828_c0_g1_i1.p1 TRINITY_DN44828_c0_g1~~TRINITY_DN44828_c0_g1_i1.p1  ORF type:complete len:120 (+),score=24.84 TRINITY_DN44828_c0_g1_i1:162-521(+)